MATPTFITYTTKLYDCMICDLHMTEVVTELR